MLKLCSNEDIEPVASDYVFMHLQPMSHNNKTISLAFSDLLIHLLSRFIYKQFLFRENTLFRIDSIVKHVNAGGGLSLFDSFSLRYAVKTIFEL